MRPDSDEISGYRSAGVLAAVGAGCYLATMVVLAAYALAFDAVDTAPAWSEDGRPGARFFAVGGALAALCLATFASAWYVRSAAEERGAPWDILALGAAVVFAAALLLAVLLLLVLCENEAIVAMLIAVARRTTDLRLEAVRAALPQSLAGSLQPGDGAAPPPPETLT